MFAMQALVRTVVILIWLPVMAAAQGAEEMSALRSAHAAWLVRHDVRGTGAFAHAGVAKTAVGDATTPAELASLGKSITGLCVAALVDAGHLDFSEGVRDILGHGPDASVAALVTHTSGIVADITQPLMALWPNTPGTRTGRSPLDYPHVAIGEGDVFHGLGTLFRRSDTGAGRYDFWHFGALCFPGLLRVGAYAVTWGGDWSVVLTHKGCVDDTARRALDATMAQAAGVTP